MLAREVMASPVVTTTADAAITDVVDLMLKHKISALPVVDADGGVMGIVSEGDLIQRDEIGTLPHRSCGSRRSAPRPSWPTSSSSPTAPRPKP